MLDICTLDNGHLRFKLTELLLARFTLLSELLNLHTTEIFIDDVSQGIIADIGDTLTLLQVGVVSTNVLATHP